MMSLAWLLPLQEMIQPTWLDIMTQIPLAAVNIYVVILFLRYLEKADERQRAFMTETRKENTAAVLALAVEVGELKELTIEHNAVMLSAVTEMRANIAGRRKADKTEKTRPIQ
jgi:hypothetical protein